MTLQQSLSRQFPNNAINVNVSNNVSLTVTFANSPIAQLPESEQARVARQVAEFVRDHYPGYSRLRVISIGFSDVKGGGGVTFTSTRVPFRFTPQQLGPPAPEPKTPAPKAAALARG